MKKMSAGAAGVAVGGAAGAEVDGAVPPGVARAVAVVAADVAGDALVGVAEFRREELEVVVQVVDRVDLDDQLVVIGDIVTRQAARGIRRIVDRVTCLTTPGRDIDAVVTEVGIAVNPARPEIASRARAAVERRLTSRPRKCTLPLSGFNPPVTCWISVDFPAPFGPSRPNTEPLGT